jgi:flagellar basal body-associated protein FliL
MEMNTVRRLVFGNGRGGWAVAVLLIAPIVIGLLVFGKNGGGWDRSPFVRNAFLGDRGGSDDGDWTPGTMLRLPDVVVGLRGEGAKEDLYVDAAFDLELASEQDREAVRKQSSRMRDETIGFLSELSPADLRGSGGLERTKARLLERFRNVLPSQRFTAIYLTYLAVAPRE